MQTAIPFPLLGTARLLLRQPQDGDAPALFALRAHEEVNRYLDRPKPESVDAIRDRIAQLNEFHRKGEGIFWAISLKNDPRLIGTICYWNFTPDRTAAELGYELHPDHQGNGYMQEALAAVLVYGMETMNLCRIEAWTSAGNAASIRLLEKYQFRRAPQAEHSIDRSTDTMNTVIYTLTPDRL